MSGALGVEPIAIVGSACRFPGGASSPSKLWGLLNEPRDVVKDFKSFPIRPNLDSFYSANGEQAGRTEVQSKAYILEEDPTVFDAAFFNISPLEAAGMDPQQRILLETVYESLEAAGWPLDRIQGTAVAVFAGCMTNDYYDIQVRDPETMPRYNATGTTRSILANRISYAFDLKGPSLTVDTACSSSLVCLHLAVQSLRNRECESAIVVGSNLILDPTMFQAESSLHMLSEDSRSRMWDAGANGYARGEGFASLVLKPLSRAVTDDDHIECVIRHTVVNSDGRTTGITMPSPGAQAAMIRRAYLDSGLDPVADRPQFFECHGTGTLAGDPVEAQAVHDAFFPPGHRENSSSSSSLLDADAQAKLFVGSIKTVIGHLEGCAGIAGILKASLAIQHRKIPPNMLFNELNPAIAPFYGHLEIPTRAVPWPPVKKGPLRASVNSFGFGGTNAHAILESFEPGTNTAALPQNTFQQDEISGPFGPFVLSAQTAGSLSGAVVRLMEYLQANPDVSLSDVSAMLQLRRSVFPLKTFFSGTSREDLIRTIQQHLAEVDSGRKPIGVNARLVSQPPEVPGTLAIFTGQGAQWPAMGAGLLRSSSVFRSAIEACEQALATCPDPPSWSLKDELMAEGSRSRVSEAALSQPLCTAVQIGLVDLLRACRVRLDAVVGHSSGEIAAVYAAGIISATDAIRIAYYRGLYAKLARGTHGQKGAMLAVAIPYDNAVDFCQESANAGRLAAAASNSPSSATLSGDREAIDRAREHFEKHKIFARPLRVDTAYHSHHMGPCAAPYLEALKNCNITVKPPRPDCVWISSVYGDIGLPDGGSLDSLELLSAEYWVQNMVQPVLFSQALQTSLWAGGPFDLVVEVGCHPALKGPSSQTIHTSLGTTVPYTGVMARGENDRKSFAEALGAVWQILGPSAVDFDGYIKAFQLPGFSPPRVVKDLPTYAWDHEKSYWRESRISRRYRRAANRPHPLLGRRMPDDSDTEMRWRNAIFPAAGYVSMALEAAMAFAAGKSIRLIEVLNLKMSRALVVEDGSAGVEVLFSMSRCPTPSPGEPDVVLAEVTCQICTDETSGELVQNCCGKVAIYLGPPSSGSAQLAARSLARPKLRPVDLEAYYDSVERLGLTYHGHFRGLVAAERTLGHSRAWAAWPHGVDVDFGNVPHPGCLDTGFQSLFVAYGSPTSDQLWAPYLPVEIKRFSFDPHVDYRCGEEGARMELEAFVTHGSAKVLQGDVHFFTEEGGGRCGIQVEGIVLHSFTEPKPSNDRLLFTQTLWKSDMLGGCLDAELARAAASAPHDPELMEAIERVALYYFCRLSAAIQPDEVDSMKWHHQQLLKVVRMRIAEIRDGADAVAKREWLEDTREDIEALVCKFPGQIDLRLGSAIGDNLIDIVRGKTEALQVMMEDDMLGCLYSDGCGFGFLNNFLSLAASRITHKHPRIDILEIGAGTGAATRRVLDVIGQCYASYTYTDISAGFFGKAASKFSDHGGKMSFRVLDVEKPPGEQGYAEHSYGLVLASNVLHATRSLRETLRHTRSLLKPGGYLLLAEVTGELLRFLLLMGSLPGWWLGVDEGRTTGPGSSLLAWDQVLRETGFAGVDISAIDNRDPKIHSFSVIVSQALDDDFALIRDPFSWIPVAGPTTTTTTGSLLIIGGKTLATAKLIQQTQKLLPFSRSSTVVVDSVDRIQGRHVAAAAAAGTCAVLCLAELDEPIFAAGGVMMTDERMHALQTLFGSAGSILWVTEGRRLGGEPLANMTVGLARALLEELPHLTLQLLDVDDGKETLKAHGLAEVFLRLLVSTELENKTGRKGNGNGMMLWTIEPELYYDGQAIHIPRIVLDRPANDRANASRRRIARQVDLNDETVEIRPGQGGLRLVENGNCGSAPEQQEQQHGGGYETIRVRYSMELHADDVARNEVLCLGVLAVRGDEDDQKMVMAFADAHASLIRPAADEVYVLPDHERGCAELLAAAARQLIAAAILATLDRHPAALAVVVHGADEGLADAVARRIKEHDDRRGRGDLHFSSSCAPDALPEDWLSLHPSKTAHSIRLTLPRVSGLFIDLSGDTKVASRLPPTWAVHRYDRFASSPAKQLDDAFTHAVMAENTTPREKLNILPVEEIAASPGTTTFVAACPAVVDWTTAYQLPVDMEPLDAGRLVHPDKTYLMVGMTSELGLSLCRYLVVHGARHLVLTSRNPSIGQDWLDEMARYGATIRVYAVDASDMPSLRSAVDEISQAMPPIAGVCNAALVLSDRLFLDMSAEEMQVPFRAKVQGTKNLDALFSNTTGSRPPLDFFVCFSSLGSITGNAGQSNYHAANMFMAGLAAQRRARGLAASVIHIGLVVDVGYVARAGRQIEDHLRSRFYLPLSEPDIHNVFAEAILASSPVSGRAEIICGMEPSSNAPGAKRTAPWINNPRFSHMIMERSTAASQENATAQQQQQSVHIRQLMEEARDDPEATVRLLTTTFLAKVENMLQLARGTAKAEAPLVDLGCDSLLAVEIRAWFLTEVNVEVPILKILSGDTIAELCTAVANQFVAALAGKPEAATSDVRGAVPVPQTFEEPERPVPAGSTDQGTYGGASGVSEPDTSTSTSRTTRGSTSADTEVTASQALLQTPVLEEAPAERDLVRCEPMSYAQARLWFLRTFLPDPTTFNIVVSFRVEGRLRPHRLRDAFQQVLSRHESLRTCFFTHPISGRPTQGVLPEARGAMDVVSSGGDAAVVEEVFSRYKTHHWQLERGDAMHATLVSHSPDSHTFVLGHHHILMDGTALYLFLRDLDHAYRMATATLPPVSVQPCDFARAEREQTTPSKLRAELEYWKAEHARLPDLLPLLPFARVKSRKTCDTWDGNTCGHEMSAALTARIKTACQGLGITPFHFHLATIQLVLCRLLDIDDICIGIADANRADDGLANTVGFFLNLLPLRLRLTPDNNGLCDARFADVARSASAKALAACNHARAPFDLILDAVGAPRSSSHSPLFQVAVNYRPVTLTEAPLGDCRMVVTSHHDARNPYDLAFNLVQTRSGTTCLVELTTRDYLYSAESCQLLLRIYIDALERLSTEPYCSVSELQAGQHVISDHHPPSISRGPTVDFGWPTTLVERFDEMAAADRHAHHVAVVDAAERVTYAELAQRSHRIAASLLDILDHARQGAAMAVLLEPTVSTVAAMLAILRIGCIYLPLDLSIPQARHAAMLEDANAAVLVCDDATVVLAHQLLLQTTIDSESDSGVRPVVDGKKKLKILNLTTDLSLPSPHHHLPIHNASSSASTANAPSFLLYTSGSTGRPKGILLAERGVLNYLAAKSARLHLNDESDVVVALQQSSLGFDMSLAQMFNALANGGRVVMAPRAARGDPVALTRLMRDEGVNFTIATPSEAALWLRCYGPTELSCATSFETVSLDHPECQPVLDDFSSIGKPIANTTIVIANELGEPVPTGFPGEICVGGVGVALGYSPSAALHDDRFVPNRFATAEERAAGLTTMYRTGDKGRLLRDGSLVFMGRLDGDSTVKLRGLRIDLDDVASNLIRASGGSVVDACVVVKGEEEETERLVAYVVLAENASETVAELARAMKNMQLPRYMIPSRLVSLDRLPTSANGKVDRRALASLPLALVEDPEFETKPRREQGLTLLEGQLKLIWEDVLGQSADREPLARDSDFFMVGGNSHLIVKLRAAIEETQGVSVPLRDLYSASTLASMAATLAAELGAHKPVEICWETELDTLHARFLASEGASSAAAAVPRSPRQPNEEGIQVVLTGATSFLGMAILRALLQHDSVSKIHCLAVNPDDPSLLPTTTTNTTAASSPDKGKLVVYHGSLARPDLGLAPAEWSALEANTDLILHAGAHGHCLNSYHSLVAPNVHATLRLAQLARAAAAARGGSNGVPLHFISSNRVALLGGGTAALGPVAVPHHIHPPQDEGGFTSSKWVCERMLERAVATTPANDDHRDRGSSVWKVVIHRPCALVGEDAPAHDALNALLRFARRMRAVPDTSTANMAGWLDLKSVDEVAADVVSDAMRDALSYATTSSTSSGGGGGGGNKDDDDGDTQREKEGGGGPGGAVVRFRHHTSGVRVPVARFRERMEELYGGRFEELEMGEWLERARGLGLEELIVSYLQSLMDKGETVVFPYMGEADSS
ncbi:polyketide synthase module [Chaetomium strumarium]|uniref:Polyketide synthase module n=1 Tax=Chaetomium strumarium TaxID=1170767 RepID=A0AAJ0H1L0_9PEZI|nr:polyketide synthase module [Chaetomium strumarium]